MKRCLATPRAPTEPANESWEYVDAVCLEKRTLQRLLELSIGYGAFLNLRPLNGLPSLRMSYPDACR
jgi:hypothetical protein